ncbi:DUF2283 domain-containing protein [Glutamicibacter sp. FBE19]|uniref:DUF2283 domain-containing protein n=1 Tax=Glutamicibacter sp. FBE19 TaxID=2761534 RepID=UPI001896685C|nr:DUF2283 domain-containing protein [Glutamicibacter sp. FBE19]MBF6671886.1 DUF2283 domain-containing protein [Glutamicibacter sp. FBE19]
MNKPLSMTYDREAGAGYIALTGEPIGEAVEVENTTLPFGVNVDLDVSGEPIGLELLGQVYGTVDQFLASVADGSLREALAAAGYEIRKLFGHPVVVVHRIA